MQTLKKLSILKENIDSLNEEVCLNVMDANGLDDLIETINKAYFVEDEYPWDKLLRQFTTWSLTWKLGWGPSDHQDDMNTWRNDDDYILNIMPMAQDVAVDLIVMDLEIPKYFSTIKSPEIWITYTSASNNGTAHKRAWNESSSNTIEI